jgi:hypothetical protein
MDSIGAPDKIYLKERRYRERSNGKWSPWELADTISHSYSRVPPESRSEKYWEDRAVEYQRCGNSCMKTCENYEDHE